MIASLPVTLCYIRTSANTVTRPCRSLRPHPQDRPPWGRQMLHLPSTLRRSHSQVMTTLVPPWVIWVVLQDLKRNFSGLHCYDFSQNYIGIWSFLYVKDLNFRISLMWLFWIYRKGGKFKSLVQSLKNLGFWKKHFNFKNSNIDWTPCIAFLIWMLEGWLLFILHKSSMLRKV